jgi:hypothetical protein
MTPLILTLAAALRRLWRWRDEDYVVLENGVVVGRIFYLDAVGPRGRPLDVGAGTTARYDAPPSATGEE